MLDTLETVTPTKADAAEDARADAPTATEMLWEVVDLAGGLGVILLPLFILAVPGAILLLPLVVPAIALGLVAGVAAAPYLLVRAIRRRVP